MSASRVLALHSNRSSQPRVACFTSFTFAYLAKARLLAWSLKRFHPDWHFVAVITDLPPDGLNLDLQSEDFDEIWWGQDLDIAENMAAWMFTHDVVEVCTAVKGRSLERLALAGYEKVIYLDPDIAVLNSLQSILNLLDTNEIVLTPHQLQPEQTGYGIVDNEIGSLKFGIYNLGFVAIRGKGEGLRFAQWWASRLRDYCYDDVPNGLFTDQRWCDHVPVFFDGVHILKDPGCNIASWNLSNRMIEVDEEGALLVNGSPLKFYHFTKFGVLGEVMTARYANNNSLIYELWAWYGRKLDSFSAAIPKGWWAFGRYDNGETIVSKHRALYRSRADLQCAFPNPFSSSGDSYIAWLQNAKLES